MPKEIPILFSTPMVQAILEGRKTETRREVKPGKKQQWLKPDVLNMSPSAYPCLIGTEQWAQFRHPHAGTTQETVVGKVDIAVDSPLTAIKCPYGKTGDVLWVRESFRKYYHVDESGYTDFDNEIIDYAADNPEPMPQVDGDGFHMYNKDGSEKYIPFKPSIHMPKAAARIWLEVVEVKVERLQDISPDSAQDEGMAMLSKDGGRVYKYGIPDADGLPGTGKSIGWVWSEWEVSATTAFQKLWESINSPESWTANPWVWVIKFKVLSTTGKPQNLTT